MPKLGITVFHNFLRKDLRSCILTKYWNLEILSEADLQVAVWQEIVMYLRRHDQGGDLFKVLNKPFLKDLHVHPDIVVFRKRRPWVVIELKERKQLKASTALRERKRLLCSRKAFGAKRGYLIFVARYGDGKTLHGPKRKGAYYFFEVPIILEKDISSEKVKEWEKKFKYWSKYKGDNEES